jgi:hypothetical protein
VANKGKKLNITPESRAKRSESGQLNLAAWKKKNPAGAKLTHGAKSVNFRRRFDDRRTNEGKQLSAVIRSLEDDLGGTANLTAPIRLLIDSNVRPKLITLMCINQYINKQESLINDKGELLSCLARNYISFSNALRRDLEALVAMAKTNGNKARVPSLDQWISQQKSEK